MQAQRFEVHCHPPVALGNKTYPGIWPIVAGRTDLSVSLESSKCDDDFCQLRTKLWAFGANSTSTECVLSTQTVSVTGLASFERVGEAGRSCHDFNIDSPAIGDADPAYALVWRESVGTFTEAVGRWPRSAWMGGLAFELSMDPPFEGWIMPADAAHIHTRLFGGMHRLLSGSYMPTTQEDCTGKAQIGAGKIIMSAHGRVLGIGFGILVVLLAVYIFATQRDIQLMVGVRNFRRAVSALSSPLRFAVLLDRTAAGLELSDMCDETPEALAAASARLLVSIGGDIDVGGPVGHACISTIENVDVFSAVRTYKGQGGVS